MKNHWILASLACALFTFTTIGCTPAAKDATEATASADAAASPGQGEAGGPLAASQSPGEAVQTFLTAVQEGNEEIAAGLLTQQAQEQMSKAEMVVQPPGSPDASFTIGDVVMLPEHNGAQVVSIWSDINLQGQREDYEITWLLRQETAGWRVAGMITRLFEDSIPLTLNFEDPDDMRKQVERADAELAARNQPAPTPADIGNASGPGFGTAQPASATEPLGGASLRTATQPEPLQPNFNR